MRWSKEFGQFIEEEFLMASKYMERCQDYIGKVWKKWIVSSVCENVGKHLHTLMVGLWIASLFGKWSGMSKDKII